MGHAMGGRGVTVVVVRDRRLGWPIDANLEAAITNQVVRSIERRAKYLLIGFDKGTLIVHLGMSGSLRVLGAHVPPQLHDHWDIQVDSGSVLRFHDPPRFATASSTH